MAGQCPGLEAVPRLSDPHCAILPGHQCLPRGAAQPGASCRTFHSRLCLVTWAQQETNFAADFALPEPLKLAQKKKILWSNVVFLFLMLMKILIANQ